LMRLCAPSRLMMMRRCRHEAILLLMLVACAPPPVDPGPTRFSPDSGTGSTNDGGGSNSIVQIRTVIDGDTVILSATASLKGPDGRNLSGETIRLLGVDAPEIARPPMRLNPDCWGDESHLAARNLMQGLSVTLEYSSNDYRDVYDRLLAYVVMRDGKVANEVLIESGAARSFDQFQHRYRSRYEQLEKNARDRNLGVWTCP
jgi:endonuclease YncB( thermonuclease family)